VSDASQHNLARLERITQESLKQCLRPWLMQLGFAQRGSALSGHDHAGSSSSMQSATLDAALKHDGPVIVADATGTPWHASAQSLLNDAGNKPIRICIGPEGGFTPDELARARAANACMTRFTPHTLRIETAAIVAAGLALAHAQAKHEPL
jgi:RsmE family RNA methyltransferase